VAAGGQGVQYQDAVSWELLPFQPIYIFTVIGSMEIFDRHFF
jgi:hypothetical protein